MTREPFEYNDIFYQEVIYWLEQKWGRVLDSHERNILLHGYKYGRRVEMESYYDAQVINWQLDMQKKG